MRLRARSALLATISICIAVAGSVGAATVTEPAPAATVATASAPMASAPAPVGAASEPAPIARRPAPMAAAPVAPGPMAGSSAGSLLQTILALSAVLGLLAGLAWFLKRYGPKPPAGAAPVRIVGALNLGGRERIMVIEVADQWIVVGAAPGRVNALATMPKQQGVAVLSDSTAVPAATFGDWLKQTIEKRNAK